jgi:peptide-methionine (S)-S-oxide reductase
MTDTNLQTATFAGGCFWCTEAIFKRLKGVASVMPGYAGGTTENPKYDDIHSGTTGHAESIQVQFDPAIIPYTTLVEVFFATHDPTTLNRQDYDQGTEYRSIIFYHNEEQKNMALTVKEQFEKDRVYNDPIVTEITPFQTFYPAESEHKDYYDNNPSAPYCQIITYPKVQKLLKEFSNQVKDAYKK